MLIETIDQPVFLEHALLALSLVLIYAAAKYAIKRINIEGCWVEARVRFSPSSRLSQI